MKRILFLLLAILIFNIGFSQDERKDTTTLEEVVVTGSKIETLKKKVPFTVSQINRQEIENTGQINILPTLKSRCLTFKINLSFSETVNIANFLLGKNLFDLINNDLINYYNTPGDFINLINFSEKKNINLNEFNLISFLYFLIDNSHYKKNRFIKDLTISYIELYFLKIYISSKAKKNILEKYFKFIQKIHDANLFNLDEESLFIEFKSKILNE